jgi:hypothetical protein
MLKTDGPIDKKNCNWLSFIAADRERDKVRLNY